MLNTVLSSHNLCYTYPQGSALSFPDISIAKGQHSLLLGDSGAGKTTLLNLLSGLMKPSAGEVFIVEQPINEFKGSQLDAFRAKNLSIIFQEAHLLKNLTVFENIKLAQSLAKNKVDEKAIFTILEELQLSDKTHRRPGELSRGQKQRVAIARALINRPAILVADEPTASLDDTNTAAVLKLLLEIAENYGSTLLIATHDKRIKDQFAQAYQL